MYFNLVPFDKFMQGKPKSTVN